MHLKSQYDNFENDFFISFRGDLVLSEQRPVNNMGLKELLSLLKDIKSLYPNTTFSEARAAESHFPFCFLLLTLIYVLAQATDFLGRNQHSAISWTGKLNCYKTEK